MGPKIDFPFGTVKRNRNEIEVKKNQILSTPTKKKKKKENERKWKKWKKMKEKMKEN